MLRLAQSELGIPIRPIDLDQNPWLLNCPNGTVDLKTGELKPHCREDLLTQLCPTNFNPDRSTYHWDRFLELVFDHRQDLLDYGHRLLGYMITGDVREQVLPIFYGVGANGKSTLINTFMKVIGNDYTMQAPSDLLMAKRHNSHPTERADLFRKRLVTCAETEQNRRLNEALVKALTGGERIRARRMREDFWEFDPTHKVILCTNHKPQVRGTDHAIWRRLRLLPFEKTFWNPDDSESGPDELRQDKELMGRLLLESEGILFWAVPGCLE